MISEEERKKYIAMFVRVIKIGVSGLARPIIAIPVIVFYSYFDSNLVTIFIGIPLIVWSAVPLFNMIKQITSFAEEATS